jgi:hypothetical protein
MVTIRHGLVLNLQNRHASNQFQYYALYDLSPKTNTQHQNHKMPHPVRLGLIVTKGVTIVANRQIVTQNVRV